MADTVLALQSVTKMFGSVAAVRDATLTVERGEVYTLLGPSGCGKTTTLRMVAGLERPDAGVISYNGVAVADPAHGTWVPPNKRNVGMVFQSYAIWPHMTVFGNIAYALRLRKVPPAEARQRVARVLEMVGMAGLEERPATLLSGGQQQRVALCRALVYEPDILLLDEPFSNLDAKLRAQMRVEVRLLQRKLGITVLLVTHDQVEALSMSDRIAVMHQGGIEQVGPPQELYDHPASQVVRDFLGQVVTIPGEAVAVTAGGTVAVRVRQRSGPDIALHGCSHDPATTTLGKAVNIAIRPEDVEIGPGGGSAGGDDCLQAIIDALLFVGDRYEAQVTLATGAAIQLVLPRSQNWQEGQSIALRLPPEKAQVWAA